MKRGYADGPYGQIHYHDAGVGRPLVLIHQAPMSARQYDSVFDRLVARGIRPIAIDCPGFGMSDPTPFVPHIEQWACVVPTVLEHLGVQSAVHYGHHTGALVVTEVEQQFPQCVEKLVLGGVLILSEAERKFFDGIVEDEKHMRHKADGSHLVEAFKLRYDMYGKTPEPDPELITRYTVERFMGLGPFWHGHHAAFAYDHAAAFMKIQRPTLILTNTGDQIYENAKVAHSMRPDFAFVEIPGGGIDITDQCPEEWGRGHRHIHGLNARRPFARKRSTRMREVVDSLNCRASAYPTFRRIDHVGPSSKRTPPQSASVCCNVTRLGRGRRDGSCHSQAIER